MERSSTMNLVDSIIDEIALEGLDGITLEALWDRVAIKYQETTPLSPRLKEQIWNICLRVRDLSFYELEKERGKLIIFDRYEFVDPDLGIILESDNTPDDIYEHCPIDDSKNGIRGSCATYYTRTNVGDIAQSLSVHEAEKNYGRKLVIVASQAMRLNALMDKTVCPTLELTVLQYCFLERVGRSRYHGEVTQGKLSLSLLKEDPKSLFYHRKYLLRHKLLTKQTHHQKSGGHSCTGSLLHLPRFYIERKPKVIFLAEKVIEILKSRPNHIAEYSEIKKESRIENAIKKLFKTPFFQKVVKTDLLVPWRTMYPNAAGFEWQCKNNTAKEKMLRVVQLIDPNVDINDLLKDEVAEDNDPYELDVSQQKYSVPFLKQANSIVESCKEDGIGQSELGIQMGLPRLQSRTIFRNLAKLNIVATYMDDVGRQRVTKYVSRKFESESRMSKLLHREIHKMKKLAEVPTVKTKVVENISPIEKTLASATSSENEKNELKEIIIDEEAIRPQVDLSIVKNDNSNSFNAAIRILRKYKLTGCKRNYKKTFCNVSEMENSVIEKKRRKLIGATKKKVELRSDVKSDIPENISLKELEEKLIVSKPDRPNKRKNDIIGLKDFANCDQNNMSNVTYRLLKRANIIVEAVREHKVIDDMVKLMKVINKDEEEEGYDVKIDKKSMIRLLQRLAKDNLVKNIKLILSTNVKKKILTFICDPSIDVNHTVIRSAVEQAKIKFCITGSQKVKTTLQSNAKKLETSSENTDGAETIETLRGNDKEAKKILQSELVYDRKAGKRYGYVPKFVRMQALHAYLFYIVYEHPGKPRESQERLTEILRSKGASIDEKLEKEMSQIFNTEIGWKMFVPPLPKHHGWPTGWAMICDILLRMPLSLFLKVYKVCHAIRELDEYTDNPIKKHFLVKDLPVNIRNVLLIKRKYIFCIYDVIMRLCYIGLLQFGPRKCNEKDKVFVYLNRKTELLDTTSSAAHYHKVEAKVYPAMRYHFTSLQTVLKYWYKLWITCVNTRLGGRLVVQGKDIVLEDLTKKNEMIDATKARQPEEASSMDNGHVPGDRRGAAGIDSAFFAHLKRNWNWESSHYSFQRLNEDFDIEKTNQEGERDIYMATIKYKPVKFTEFHGLKKFNGPKVIDAIDLRKTQKKNPNSGNGVPAASKPKNNGVRTMKGRGSNRQRSYVRRVLPKAKQKHVRPRAVKYDEIDYGALQRMDKLRVDWDMREDNILLICKVAMMYLCPNPRTQMIGFTAVRDVLRSYSLTSHNKTSRACQRRLLYMLKKPETHHSVALGVEELKQDFYVNRRYGDIVDKLKKEHRSPQEYEDRVNLVFRDLVTYIAKKHYDISDIQTSELNLIPATIGEFHLFHRVKYPKRVTSVQGFHDDTTNDIHSSTINSVIHSSMCCVKDRRSWAYQLFRIYQQYPEWLLRSAMVKIRTDQMVSVKKNYAFAIRKQTNACMPMSSSQYQLSIGYMKKLNTKLPYSVFKEAWDFFMNLAKRYYENYIVEGTTKDEKDKTNVNDMITSPVNGGTIVAIHDYINVDGLDFDLEIPRHTIMLDPTMQKDDGQYIRIARRYHDLLRNLEHINIDEILDHEGSRELRDLNNDSSANSRIIEEATNENDGHSGKSFSKIVKFSGTKDSSNSETELDTKKIQRSTKQSDSQEANLNTDTEANDSERESNFDEEDCYDEIDVDDFEDDNLICFIDGTKIRLTREDIENSGFQINTRMNVCSTDEKTKRAIEQNEERSSHKNTGENDEEKNKSFDEDNNAGIEDDTKMEIDNSGDSRKESNNEGNPCVADNNISQMEIDLSRNNENFNADETQNGNVRLNELMERKNVMKLNRLSYNQTCESNDIQKRYTAFAMLKMREELNDLALNDSQHAHDFFVLNMFKIYYSFRRSKIENPWDLSTIQGLRLPVELLPLDRNSYGAVMADLKKYAIFPKISVSYEKFRDSLNATEIFKRSLDAVYEFIHDKREVGASLSQLSDKFHIIIGKELYDILWILKENRMVLRSGVTNTRYIHQKYADPWLIHSYKIMRLHREAQQPVAAGSLYVVNDDDNKDTNESREANENAKENKAEETDGITEIKNEINDAMENNEGMDVTEENENEACKKDSESNPVDSEAAKSSQAKMRKSRTCLLPTKDIYRAAKQLDLDTAEEIRVVVRPWIRIDGALNRRVLDRMLGGVLAYCLVNPGVYLTRVQEKFSPAIQPFHTKELVEILMRLGCLRMGTAKKSRVTIFSKPASTRIEFSAVPERFERSEEELVIEPLLGATMKFSMFLSNRTYTSDFLA